MARLSALARFVVLEFGPLVAFFILALTLGVKAAGSLHATRNRRRNPEG